MSEPYGGYSPQDVIFENLRELEERRSLLREQLQAHLRELAREIDSDLSPDHFLSSLPDYCQSLREELLGMTGIETYALTGEQLLTRVEISVILCRELCRILEGRTALTPDFFLPSNEETLTHACHIAYQKSLPADDAFLSFSKVLNEARVSYADSFSAVCEEILSERCEYGILPMETSTEGSLSGFPRLLDRYGLRILLSVEVPTHGERGRTRFALLGRDTTPPPGTDGSLRSQLELSLASYEEHPVEELLLAARLCGLSLETMHVSPATEDSGRPRFHPRFSTVGAELCSFLLYLAMEAPHCDILGFYAEIG